MYQSKPKRRTAVLPAPLLIIVLCAVLLTGCGGGSYSGSGSSESMSASYDGGSSYSTPSMMYTDSNGAVSGSTTTEQVRAERNEPKIIYTGDVSLETENFDGTMERLEEMVDDAGGYFQSSDVYRRDSYNNSSRSFREASITVRIPASEFDGFIRDLEDGKGFAVVRQSVSSEDVSEQYYDLETRIKSAQNEVDRLNELMERAEDVADVISVEQALTDAVYKLESLQGQRNGYDRRIDYSYLNINLSEVTALTMTVRAASYGSRLMESFANGFTGGMEFIGDFVLFVAGNWLVILLLIAGICIFIMFRRRRKRKKLEQKKISSPEEPKE